MAHGRPYSHGTVDGLVKDSFKASPSLGGGYVKEPTAAEMQEELDEYRFQNHQQTRMDRRRHKILQNPDILLSGAQHIT